MADSIKFLGRSNPGTTHTPIYTCGRRGDESTDSLRGGRPGFSTVISSIIVCETNNLASAFTIRVVPYSVTTISDNRYDIFSASSIGARNTKIISPGITISQGDYITVYGSTANVNFFVFGAETS